MADIAASVLARLKNKAAETGRSNQLCLQLFCQEEFLRRLQRSTYADNFILKGGLLVYALTNFDSRVTVDIDFLMRNIPNTQEDLKPVLEKIIAVETGNDFINFEIAKLESIAITKKYAGVGATVIARIKNTRINFGIDFGAGDVIVPKQERRIIPTQLEGFDAPEVNAYSIETTVVEKMDAILSLMEYSSRMKDYYDILYISRRFDFDGKTLCRAATETFTNRNREYTIQQFEQLLSLGEDTAMEKKWTAFLKRVDITEVVFSEAMKTIGAFLREVVEAAISSGEVEKSWSAINGCWVKISLPE